MSDVQQALDKDDPRMVAWERFTASEDYANAKKWAADPASVIDGALWRAFLEGWATSTPPSGTPVAVEREPGWIPIEFAPRGPWLLTISKNGAGYWCTPQVARWHGGEWVSPVQDANVTLYHQPVAWMALPLSPDSEAAPSKLADAAAYLTQQAQDPRLSDEDRVLVESWAEAVALASGEAAPVGEGEPSEPSPTPAEGELREALADLSGFVEGIVERGEWRDYGDWACVECRPESDMLEAGFACAYHTAKRLSTRTSDGGR